MDAGAPTWSASSRTGRRSFAWSARRWPSSTTSGRWPAVYMSAESLAKIRMRVIDGDGEGRQEGKELPAAG